jgi:hypothetical protein
MNDLHNNKGVSYPKRTRRGQQNIAALDYSNAHDISKNNNVVEGIFSSYTDNNDSRDAEPLRKLSGEEQYLLDTRKTNTVYSTSL